jgi:hypothetical protein
MYAGCFTIIVQWLHKALLHYRLCGWSRRDSCRSFALSSQSLVVREDIANMMYSEYQKSFRNDKYVVDNLRRFLNK